MGEVDSCLALIQEGEYSPLHFSTDCKSRSTKKYLLWNFLTSKKRLYPQIENPQTVTFAEGPQI
jgi:hypothetical protein